MKILFDQGVPVPLRRQLAEHVVDTALKRRWSRLRNSALLDHGERKGYQFVVMTNQNLRHQQNLADRRLAIMVLLAASWPRIRQRVDDIRAVVEQLVPGQYLKVPI